MKHTKHHTIDYIEFCAQDLEKVKTFYSQVFGWSFVDYGPEYTAFNDGKMEGGFGVGTPSKNTGALVILYSEALEKTQEAVMNAGGTISKNIFTFPGGRRFHFIDTTGNELAVWSDV